MTLIKRITLAVSIAVISVGNVSASFATTTVTKIYDGDTVTLGNGERLRLIQIDAPELASAECYGAEARTALVKLMKGPGALKITSDPGLDKVDRYGRILGYLFKGNINLNLKMVEIGAAAPYFYKGQLGIYSEQFLAAAKKAQSKKLGLWGKCPTTKLEPNFAVTTSNVVVSSANTTKCDPNYEGCIPSYPPDLDCSDIKKLGLAPVKIKGQDVHKLDRDGDGIGCDK